MGSKKDLRAELEALRLELEYTRRNERYWVNRANERATKIFSLTNERDAFKAELRAERARSRVEWVCTPTVHFGQTLDEKVIENQKATILDLTKQVDGLTVDCDALKFLVSELKNELAELKAKPSLVIPDSYKVASLEQEIRSLNLYITRLTEERDDLKKQSGDMSEAWVKVRVDFEKQVKLTEMVRKERDHFAGKCGQLQNQLNEVRVAARVTL